MMQQFPENFPTERHFTLSSEEPGRFKTVKRIFGRLGFGVPDPAFRHPRLTFPSLQDRFDRPGNRLIQRLRPVFPQDLFSPLVGLLGQRPAAGPPPGIVVVAVQEPQEPELMAEMFQGVVVGQVVALGAHLVDHLQGQVFRA